MFSIIICTYNGERTLRDTMNMILKQRLYSEYVEQFIVVDNASTDNTKNIVMEFIERGESIIYAYEPKSGLSNARLKGYREASGEWIVYVDDDNELDKNWIYNAAQYVIKKSNNNLGIFGGAIVPKLDFQPSAIEIERLKISYKMLACTDYKIEDIDNRRSISPTFTVVGAGMVVRRECLEKLEKNGWLWCSGRTLNNAVSGEDGEIDYYITDVCKMERGHCPEMIIRHNLSKMRLQAEYLYKLAEGIAEGRYEVQSGRKFYILRRLNLLLRLIKYRKYKANGFEKELRYREYVKTVEMIKKDKLFLRYR